MTTITVLGYEFRPLTADDWQSFPGADNDSLICHVNPDITLIWSPTSATLSEMLCDEDHPNGFGQRDWTFKVIA